MIVCILLLAGGVDIRLSIGNQIRVWQSRLETIARQALGEQAPLSVEDGQRLLRIRQLGHFAPRRSLCRQPFLRAVPERNHRDLQQRAQPRVQSLIKVVSSDRVNADAEANQHQREHAHVPERQACAHRIKHQPLRLQR